jgi:SAM-dependent methyltransferase
MAHDYLHAVRDFELAQALRFLPGPVTAGRPTRVLDVGAGTGRQAACLATLGYAVTAVDLPSSSYAAAREFPVIDYDGQHLPLPDGAVEVVFSSNVLEHVTAIAELLAETRRVLVPGGCAVHLLPTPAWRAWTTLTHYPVIWASALRQLAGARRGAFGPGPGGSRPRRRLAQVRELAWPSRHGERGGALTEAWYFSSRFWRGVFDAADFELVHSEAVGLFYTGSMCCAERLPLARRQQLAGWLGSACRLYMLRAKPARTLPP